MPRILFTTTFKPFGIDNQYSRKDNFPESFHNRVTREQGIFSYRCHFSSFGLHSIANNISSQSVVLEYPSYKRFFKEVKKGYDYVGISSVVADFQKVKKMSETVREISPDTKIIIGGFCADIENIENMLPVDHLCRGEGISFMREILGDSPDFKFKNPDIVSRGHSIMGIPLFGKKNPQIITGLGCPYGCEFCCPSHHYGRKHIRYFKRGKDLFNEMQRMEKRYKSNVFGFNGDDNVLLDLERAEELHECIVESGKQYEIFYFTSANNIKKFGPDKMAEIGTNVVWLGRESSLVYTKKNEGIDLALLVKELQRHGIKVVVSSMLLMEHHTPENIWNDVEEHISLGPDFSMMTFCIALPGTPLFDRHKEENRLLSGFPFEDWNGAGYPYSEHPHFTPSEGRKVRQKILDREFNTLGPSVMRIIKTDLAGCLFMRESERLALRARASYLEQKMPRYRAVLWAMARLVDTDDMRTMVEDVLCSVEHEFGPTTVFEKAQGFGVWCFGTKEKIRLKLFGDVIQPPTVLTKYQGRVV
jgi:hypothetical protein